MTTANAVAESPEVAESLKRLNEIGSLGHRIKAIKAEIEKQQTEVSGAKNALDDEKQTLTDLQRELAEVQNELDLLAQGGFSETLNFKEPAQETTADEPEVQEMSLSRSAMARRQSRHPPTPLPRPRPTK